MVTARRPAQEVVIKPPNMQELALTVVGTAPLVQLRFGEKAKLQMMEKQKAGSTAKSSRGKAARDFEEDFRQASHKSAEGWYGIPATAFRAAMIDACRLVGLEMTRAKMTVFVRADGEDSTDATPLVRLVGGEPEMRIDAVRNATGVIDLRARAMWRQWEATVRIMFDADVFTTEMVVNLLNRAGMQIGIGEGRPFSKKSAGQNWGTFIVKGGDDGN